LRLEGIALKLWGWSEAVTLLTPRAIPLPHQKEKLLKVGD